MMEIRGYGRDSPPQPPPSGPMSHGPTGADLGGHWGWPWGRPGHDPGGQWAYRPPPPLCSTQYPPPPGGVPLGLDRGPVAPALMAVLSIGAGPPLRRVSDPLRCPCGSAGGCACLTGRLGASGSAPCPPPPHSSELHPNSCAALGGCGITPGRTCRDMGDCYAPPPPPFGALGPGPRPLRTINGPRGVQCVWGGCPPVNPPPRGGGGQEKGPAVVQPHNPQTRRSKTQFFWGGGGGWKRGPWRSLRVPPGLFPPGPFPPIPPTQPPPPPHQGPGA